MERKIGEERKKIRSLILHIQKIDKGGKRKARSI